MTPSQRRESAAEVAAAATASDQEPPPPAPEPWVWTPARVLEWNRYYDLYVVAGLLLLVFLGSVHLVNVGNSSLWPNLQTGRLIGMSGPVKTDPFSYTMEGARWVNLPWVYQWVSAQVHDTGLRLSKAATRDQLAVGILVGLTALLRAATALVLLQNRRAGPGLWWVAVCVLLALGGMFMPMPVAAAQTSVVAGETVLEPGKIALVPILGGIARPAEVDPSAWGLLFLAIELWCLHKALSANRPKVLLALVPLFVLWANVDSSFLFGLLALAAAVIGLAVPGTRKGEQRPTLGFGALVLALCAGACLLNPFLWRIYPAAASPYLKLFRGSAGLLTVDQVSFFGPLSWKHFDTLTGGLVPGAHWLYVGYYVVLVAVGLLSFALNRQRFQLARFLMFALAAVLWGTRVVLAPEFALIWAVCLALNGQEWYQDRFGTEGRIAATWRAWSVGGRAVTLLVVFLLLVKGLTGYATTPAEPVFGFGYSDADFAFEAADFLADAKITGNILNLNLASGDALIWRAWPRNTNRKTFVDSREHLFSTTFRSALQQLIKALADDRRDDWQKTLDQYRIDVVMVPIGLSAHLERTYQGLLASPNWIPFYDDGNTVLFGRDDAPAEDRQVFLDRRLDAANLAYHVERAVPSLDRPPTPTTMLDRVFRNRLRKGTQPHVAAAGRWLTQGLSEANPNPDPAHCLIAIGEIRKALARNPDDAVAWQLLCYAYSKLIQAETAVMGNALPETYLNLRLRQQATALNFAIQATPPPPTEDGRKALARLHAELADVYQTRGYYDLARDQVLKIKELDPEAADRPEFQTRLRQFDSLVAQVEKGLEQMVEERQASPLQLVDPALREGCLGLAIAKLNEAEDTGTVQGAIKARLLDLECQAGWPDRALDILDTSNAEDPTLNTGPGTASFREGTVYFLIGSYEVANSFWQRSLKQVQSTLAYQSLEAARSLLRGYVREAADANLELPNLVSSQAEWEAELGLCLLEAGVPGPAGEHMETSLKLKPDLGLRPLLAYYLEHLGRPIPPPRPASKTAFTPGSNPAGELPEHVFQSEAK